MMRDTLIKRTTLKVTVMLLMLITTVAATSAMANNQVTNLKVFHRAGQTFITWMDVDQPEIKDGEKLSAVKDIRNDLLTRKISYRIYRSDKPITSLDGPKLVGSTGPMSSWNYDYYGRNPSRNSKGTAFRWVLEEGSKPMPKGSGIYVHNPKATGKAYYAVTYSADGKENKTIDTGNTITNPVEETVGQGVPVLQRIEKPEKFQFVRDTTLKYYVRWEAPPNSSIENRPIDYVIAIPPQVKTPWVVGLHLHPWGGHLNHGYGWWDNNQKGAILLASNQEPYDWWTGYHEKYYSDGFQTVKIEGVVRPYTMNRMFSFLDWLTTQHKVDLTRTFVVGNSMGGSGAVMCAIRYPNRIAFSRSWVGVHIPNESPIFKKSYESVYGKPEWGIKFQDGTPVWDYYNNVWYLKNMPNEEVGFITFSNGKNDNGIGWPQAVKFVKALQETKRPHLFIWGQSGHGQRTIYPKNGSQNLNPIDMRLDQSLPAFTSCSLDDNIGTGTRKTKEQLDREAKELTTLGAQPNGKRGRADVYDGDRAGQINRWLYWETDDIVDTKDAWEMTVALMSEAPKDTCTVDITPRRLQKLLVQPGDQFKWTNSSSGKEIQSGMVTADEHGLITITQVLVSKENNRVSITRQ